MSTEETRKPAPAAQQIATNQTASAAENTKASASAAKEAAKTTASAAETAAEAAVVTKDSAERRTEFAGDRTVFAAERTYAAWVRTGMVGLASGIGARKLLDGVVPEWMVIGATVVLLLFAVFCFVAGVWRQIFRVEPPAPDIDKMPTWILLLVNAFLSLVALVALIGILAGKQT